MNLEQSAFSLLEQFPGADRRDLKKQERMLEKFGTFAFGGFVVVVILAILAFIYLIFTKMILSGDQPFGGVIAIAFLVFAALTLTYVIWKETLKEKKQRTAIAGGNLEMPSPTERLLDNPDFESIPVPSITEDTTDLLTIKRKTRELS